MSPDARHDAQALLDALPLASYVYTLDSEEILGSNEAFARLLGYSQQQLAGMPVLQLYPEENRAEVGQQIRNVPPEGTGERVYQAADGTRVQAFVRYRNSEIMDADRQFLRTRLVVVIRSERLPQAEDQSTAEAATLA